MRTPHDKLLRGLNDIIQIDVTRRCDLFTCSNCTRLLPYRRDVRDMSLDVFRRAVDSVADWPGVVALFGGNPCAHPEFPELCRILAERIPPGRRGLWSNHLLGQGAVAQATFTGGRLNLNAHGNQAAAADFERWFPGKRIPGTDRGVSWHGAILVDWRDLGLSPEEWANLRETCPINHSWSAILQEQDGQPVAYFCEVAGAIDAVVGGRNGIPAVPGWWRKPITAYYQQVANGCDRGCGVPLRLAGQTDRAATYDASRSWLSVAKAQGPIRIHPITQMDSPVPDFTDYARLRS
jgi:hypothetical protein